MKVIIRTDASAKIGSGHVMRCLALAAGLRDKDFQVIFVCRAEDGDLRGLIAAMGYLVYTLQIGADVDWRMDAARTIDIVIKEAPVSWVIVDHYELAEEWESALRPHTEALMAIDDLANRAHNCDLLLDQNYFLDGVARYEGKIPEFCTLLLGPRFALLRPEFTAERPGRPRDRSAMERVFVFLSGVDPDNVTARVLRILDDTFEKNVRVDIALGVHGKHVEELRRYCATHARRYLHVQTSRVAELMANADIAIGAGGASSLERACLGLPSIVLSLAENQERMAEALAYSGAHLYLGRIEQLRDAALGDSLRLLSENRHLRASLSRTSFSIADGRGVNRVVRRLVRPRIDVRPAVAADCDDVFLWRNHHDTRRYFFDSRPLDLSAHRKWFAETLADHNRILLVGRVDLIDAAVLRYDVSGQEAHVSIYLDPSRHGEGYGSLLIREGSRWLKAHRSDIRAVVADVLPTNIGSLRAFLATGFRETHHSLRLEMTDLDVSMRGGRLVEVS